MPQLRSKAQNSRMHALKAKLGLTHDDLRDYAADVSDGRTDHTSELYVGEMNEIIHRLQSLASPKETPLRTVQYRRQQAGVVSIDTARQEKMLNDLWFAFPHRNGDGLTSICLRTIKTEKPRTTKEFNKIIEAVKSMNSRERTFGAFKKSEAA